MRISSGGEGQTTALEGKRSIGHISSPAVRYSSLVLAPSVEGRKKEERPQVSTQRVGTPREATKDFCTK